MRQSQTGTTASLSAQRWLKQPSKTERGVKNRSLVVQLSLISTHPAACRLALFAYWRGKGTRLRHLLRLRLREHREQGAPDDEIPTIAERIEHLDGLRRREARQLQELREALPSTPRSLR